MGDGVLEIDMSDGVLGVYLSLTMAIMAKMMEMKGSRSMLRASNSVGMVKGAVIVLAKVQMSVGVVLREIVTEEEPKEVEGLIWFEDKLSVMEFICGRSGLEGRLEVSRSDASDGHDW